MKKILNILLFGLIVILIFNNNITLSKYKIYSSTSIDISISIDKIAPKIEILDINKSNISNNDTALEYVKIAYSDELSGIASATYRFNPSNNNFDAMESKNLANNSKLIDLGWYYIELIDNAGNKTCCEFLISPAVCKMNNIYYGKLEFAIDSAKYEKTQILMLRDIVENNNIPDNKHIILEMNSKTINGNFTVNNNAYLETSNGTIISENDPAIINNGTLQINSGKYQSNGTDSVIINEGITTMAGGNVKSSHNGHGITINNGIFNMTSGTIETHNGVMVIIKSGIFNMYDGTIIGTGSNIHAGIEMSSGVANLNGGLLTFTSTAVGDLISVKSDATLNIDGTTINNECTSTTGWATISSQGIVNIKSGIIKNTGFGRAIATFNGELTISGGTISSGNGNEGCADIYNTVFNMSGGTITSSNSRWTLITDLSASITNGSIINSNTGHAYQIKGGKSIITGGTFTANPGFAIISTDTNSIVNITGATINGNTSY